MAETYTYRAPPVGMSPDMGIVVRGSDEAFIPLDLNNRDYVDFLAWITEGNPAPEGWTGPTNASG